MRTCVHVYSELRLLAHANISIDTRLDRVGRAHVHLQTDTRPSTINRHTTKRNQNYGIHCTITDQKNRRRTLRRTLRMYDSSHVRAALVPLVLQPIPPY